MCKLSELHFSNKIDKFNVSSLTQIKVKSNKTKRNGFQSKSALN